MCPYHDWGDDDFDFNQLYKAMRWIEKFYFRMTRHRPIIKEKYGTMRIEHTWAWLKSDSDVLLFCEIVKRAIHKFPKVGAELCTDLSSILETPYYRGYFQGICWCQSRSEWTNRHPTKHWGQHWRLKDD